MQYGLLIMASDKIVDYIIDSRFKLASYVCIISVTSTLNHCISSTVLQARIYFKIKVQKNNLWRFFTTKDEVERPISLLLLAVPTVLEYNIARGLSALNFDGIGIFNNTKQIHSTFCIPFHHIILGANTLRY